MFIMHYFLYSISNLNELIWVFNYIKIHGQTVAIKTYTNFLKIELIFYAFSIVNVCILVYWLDLDRGNYCESEYVFIRTLTICFSVYLLDDNKFTASICPKSISWPNRNIKRSLQTYFFFWYPSKVLSPRRKP